MRCLILCLILFISQFIACQSPATPSWRVTTPPGFVAIPSQNLRTANAVYKAVAADGAVIVMRIQRQQPEGDLAFWAAALENELRFQRNYELIDQDDVMTQDGPARVLYFRTGYDDEAFRYTLAVFVAQDTVVTIEAAAPLTHYDHHSLAITDTIRSLSR